MFKSFWKKLLVTSIVLLPAITLAAAPAWQIVPEESNITFTAIQNDAPVTGKFKSFTGVINFDPAQLNTSHVKITVDIASVNDSYNQLSDTLKTPDWFNIKAFPQAVFESNNFVKTGDNTYQAKGTLTIRDKTQPATLTFTQEEYTPTKARMKGQTTVKRTAFGVGQGEWADTKAVKDDVQVAFVITGTKK